MLWVPPACTFRSYEISFPANLAAPTSSPKSVWPEDWVTGELFATKRRKGDEVPTHALLVPLYSSDAAVSGFTFQTSADGPSASLPLYRTAIANENIVDAFRLGMSGAFLAVGQHIVIRAKESTKLTIVAYHFNIKAQLAQQASALRELGLI